jgi:UPF0755 protein
VLRRFFLALLLLLVVGAVAAGALYWAAFSPLKPTSSEAAFSVASGSSVRAAAAQLAEQGSGVNRWVFELLARATGKAGRLKAGSYELKPGDSTYDLLNKIARGERSSGSITVAEGLTFGQFRALLAQHADIGKSAAPLSEAQLMQKLGISGVASPEGLFFPDTYQFAKRSDEFAVLKIAHEALKKRLDAAWSLRAPNTPLKTPYEALILASIIEKETGTAADRAMISSVFHNRLRIGMRLQTDPTVIYGLGANFDGNLRKRDLLADTPYNTYTRAGLPPTPIALPGAAALQAAVQPAQSRNLYFVARGDGSSQFSESLEAHNRAVNTYQRGQ